MPIYHYIPTDFWLAYSHAIGLSDKTRNIRVTYTTSGSVKFYGVVGPGSQTENVLAERNLETWDFRYHSLTPPTGAPNVKAFESGICDLNNLMFNMW